MKQRILFLLLIVGILIGAFLLFRPICKIIPADSLKDVVPPLEQRQEERGMMYKTFKQKKGDWYQCKSAGERFFFF